MCFVAADRRHLPGHRIRPQPDPLDTAFWQHDQHMPAEMILPLPPLFNRQPTAADKYAPHTQRAITLKLAIHADLFRGHQTSSRAGS
jgi:hypothetical protein